MSTAELRQRDKYIEDAFGIKKTSTRLVALEKQLGIATKYDPSSIDSPLYGVEVLFAVGNGAHVHSPHYAENKVHWNKFVKQASVATFSEIDRFAGLIGGLDSPTYFYTAPSNTFDFDNYRMYKPFLYLNKWVRRFYAKLPEETVIMETIDENGYPVKIQHVLCRITKKELQPYTAGEIASGLGVINELCIYMGQKVKVAKNTGDNSTAYLLLEHPKVDTVNVEPYFRIVFDDINIADIPENGLDFMFDIELHTATIQDDEDDGGGGEDDPPETWPDGNVVVKFTNGFIILNETDVPEIILPIPPIIPIPPVVWPEGDVVVKFNDGFVILKESVVPPITLPIPPIIPPEEIWPPGDVVVKFDNGFVSITETVVPAIDLPVPPPYVHAEGDVTIQDTVGNIAITATQSDPIPIPVPPVIWPEGDVVVRFDDGFITLTETTVPAIVIPVPPPYVHVEGDVTFIDEQGNIAITETDVPVIDIPVPPPPTEIWPNGDVVVKFGDGFIILDETDVPAIDLPVPPPYVHAEGDVTFVDSIGHTAITESSVPSIVLPTPPYKHPVGKVTITDSDGSNVAIFEDVA
jgi:hypothetical protein